jgi:hypothetical protein
MSIAPIIRSVEVKAAPARAFDLFAAHMDRWWPKGRKSFHCVLRNAGNRLHGATNYSAPQRRGDRSDQAAREACLSRAG